MLDDGMGFSLLPWRPVIEQQLEQQLTTEVRGGEVAKCRGKFGRSRGLSVV